MLTASRRSSAGLIHLVGSLFFYFRVYRKWWVALKNPKNICATTAPLPRKSSPESQFTVPERAARVVRQRVVPTRSIPKLSRKNRGVQQCAGIRCRAVRSAHRRPADSIGMVSSTRANAPTARGESAAAVGTPLANLIIDESPSPPLCGADKATFPSAGTQIGDQTATAVAPDPALVLQADSLSDGNAGELCSDSRSNNGPDRIGTTETPHSPVASSDPLLLRRVPTDGSSPQRLLQIQPSSEQHGQQSPSEEQPAAAVKAPMSRIMPYPELWRDLVREVAAPAGGAVAASTRPSLCSCKKLAVSAMLRVDGGDGDGGGPTWRTGRVCANRGNEASGVLRADWLPCCSHSRNRTKRDVFLCIAALKVNVHPR